MIANIKVYKNCKIEYGKNFAVDSIEDYLSTLSNTLEYDDFQYQKIQFSMNIKLNWHESTLEMISAQNYNYLAITNYEDDSSYQTRTYYFFIIKKEWKAQNTINFQLIMDSINTFKPSVDFNINAKTHINREHKDRFKLNNFEKGFIIYGHCSLDGGSYVYQETFQSPNGCEVVNFTTPPGELPDPVGLNVTCSYTASTYTIRATYTSETDCSIPVVLRYRGYERQIDTYAEGLNPILYKKDESFLETADGTSWNLLYKNDDPIEAMEFNQVNAVSCYLIPDDSIPIKIRVADAFVIEPNDLTDSVEYYFSYLNNEFDEASMIRFLDNGKYIGNATSDIFISDTGRVYSKVVMIEKISGYIRLHQYRRFSNNELVETSVVDSISQLVVQTDLSTIYASDSASHLNYQSYSFNNSNLVVHQLDTIDNVDKTDATIIKIIKLPYAPNNFKYVSGYYEIPINWNYDNGTGWLKLEDMSSSFVNEIISSYNPLDLLKAIPLSPAITDVRNDNNESKQYMSEFYVNKAVYDSFNYPIELEKIQAPTPMDDFKLNFVTTKTINSRFLFDFKDIHYKFASQDYENIMTIARNNEVTIYSNQFINYLRTGYNYDVKAKERSDLANRVGLITSVVGNIASVGLGALSGNIPVAISSTIGASSSIVNSIISNANAMAQNEANMEQKIAQYKAQATSVSGSDDLDLMIYYSKNLLKFAEYSCSDKIKASILDLFYYGGYATDEMKTPNVNTRAWFNFLSCELIADTISYIPEEILQDIISKYSQGVTFLHKNIISSVPTWDFEQTKENWEVSIL